MDAFESDWADSSVALEASELDSPELDLELLELLVEAELFALEATFVTGMVTFTD